MNYQFSAIISSIWEDIRLSSFIVIFIAAIVALNLHLPKNKSVDFGPIKKIHELDRNTALLKLNQSCRALMNEILGLEVSNLDQTLAPFIQSYKEKKDTDLAKDFLGKFSMEDIFESISTLCSDKIDLNSEKIKKVPVKEGLQHFSNLLNDLPSSITLKTREQNQISPIYDKKQNVIGYANFENGEKRLKAKPGEISKKIKLAFISAEDRTFYQNSGVDLQGIMKAFINSGSGSQLYGGSTITQQLIKNTLLNYERTLDRKINEVLLAYAVTQRYSKDEIIEMYLNEIDFGRNAFGIKTAAKVYLGKELNELSMPDMAFLASLPQSPYNYDPAKNYDVILKRRNKVIDALRENGHITESFAERGKAEPIQYIENASTPLKARSAYFAETLEEEARHILGESYSNNNYYQILSTLDSEMQIALSKALQNALVSYEKDVIKSYQNLQASEFVIRNISEAINKLDTEIKEEEEKREAARKIEEENKRSAARFRKRKYQSTETTQTEEKKRQAWQEILKKYSNPVPDTNWELAVYLGKKSFGLKSGETVSLSKESNAFNQVSKLKFGDCLLLEKTAEQDTFKYFIRKIPEVQGAAVVLDNYSGAVLALSGGFSFKQSSWNRALKAKRQPGSVLKPFSYLAALQAGYQPNYPLQDTNHYFAPIHKGGHSWSPRDLSRQSNDWFSLRNGLVKSNNRLTAHLLKLIAPSPKESLDQVRRITKDFGLYSKPSDRSLSFILGSQETNVLRVATAYARIANNGVKVYPHLIKRLYGSDGFRYESDPDQNSLVTSVDSLSLMQLRNILGGVTSEGTARILKDHSHYLIGKTGTSDRNQDAWFAGITPQYSIAVWVGYDNADSKSKRYLRATGGRVAAPVVKEFVESEAFRSKHNNNLRFPNSRVPHKYAYYNHHRMEFTDRDDENASLEIFRENSLWEASYARSKPAVETRVDQDKPISSSYETNRSNENHEENIPLKKPKSLEIGSPEFIEYVEQLRKQKERASEQ